MTADVLGMVGLGVALLALLIVVSVTRHLGQRDPQAVPRFWRNVLFVKSPGISHSDDVPPMYTRNQRIAFVANPTKAGVANLREQAMRACAIRYLPEPMWFTTTEDDPGTGQAKRAVELGADLVVACGGDGTVRAVATGVAHTAASVGIIPMGTGNIFARNLGLPLQDPPSALRLAIDGEDIAVDVGWLDVSHSGAEHEDAAAHLFLVIAGAGLDAEMVAGADDRLKARLGWFAYFFAAVAHLGSKRIAAKITVDDHEPVESQMRTVMMGNVGRLPGGLQLMPDASVTDGQLDVATLDARGGIVGWTELLSTVMAQNAGIRDPWWARMMKASRIDHVRARKVDVRFHLPQKVQVDGEVLGRATSITARVDHGALTVRVPRGTMNGGDGEEEQPEEPSI
jgi:YegS/Rv2252/BmrU family lipid kinase